MFSLSPLISPRASSSSTFYQSLENADLTDEYTFLKLLRKIAISESESWFRLEHLPIQEADLLISWFEHHAFQDLHIIAASNNDVTLRWRLKSSS